VSRYDTIRYNNVSRIDVINVRKKIFKKRYKRVFICKIKKVCKRDKNVALILLALDVGPTD